MTRLTQHLELVPQTDRRSEPRFALNVPVTVQPLDHALQPAGTPFRATARDISKSGIGLLHELPVTHQFLSVAMRMPEDESVELVVQVLRCQPRDDLYDIGGKVVTG